MAKQHTTQGPLFNFILPSHQPPSGKNKESLLATMPTLPATTAYSNNNFSREQQKRSQQKSSAEALYSSKLQQQEARVQQCVPEPQCASTTDLSSNDQSQEDRTYLGLSILQFVEILARVLGDISAAGDNVPLHPSKQVVSVFHTSKPPQITIDKYLKRIVDYAYCSPECFILALIYLDRVVARNPKFFISSFNIHRLLITSVMVSAKFFDDKYYNNAYYAKVGGIGNKELNAMELEFLYLVNFQLHVAPDVYQQYLDELLPEAAEMQQSPRSMSTLTKAFETTTL